MTADSPLGDSNCPNCRALNPVNAVVCRSCGINLNLYRQALPHLREQETEQAQQHRLQLAEATASSVAETEAALRRQGRRQTLTLLVTLLFLAGFVVAGAAFYRYEQAARRDRLASDYLAAVACLQDQNFQCAVAGFSKLLEEEPDYPGAQAKLAESRLGFAYQLAAAGRWELAIDELEIVLKSDPANTAALVALREIYDRWIQDAIGRGDWVKVLRLRLQRNARFPEAPFITPTPVEGDV